MIERTVSPGPQPAHRRARALSVLRSPRASSWTWRGAGALFAIALPLLLISGSVRMIINAAWLYEWDFSRYNVERRTGLPREELRSAANQIVDYFNNDEEFLDVRVSFDGREVSLYREREILHMRDVKGLVRGVYRVQLWTLVYVAVFVGAGMALRKRGFLPLLKRAALWSGVGSVAVVVGLGAAALINFDAVFTQFHLISFTNDLWRLDPHRDYLLIMFPQGFFLDATIAIALFTLLGFGIVLGATWWLARRFGPRSPSPRG